MPDAERPQVDVGDLLLHVLSDGGIVSQSKRTIAQDAMTVTDQPSA